MKRTVSTYVRLKDDDRPGWELETTYKVINIDVSIVGQQTTSQVVKDYDEEDITLDQEDQEFIDEVEDQAPLQEVVQTLLLLGNHKTGALEWFHSSEVIYCS